MNKHFLFAQYCGKILFIGWQCLQQQCEECIIITSWEN